MGQEIVSLLLCAVFIAILRAFLGSDDGGQYCQRYI